ncbi:YlxQ family RNA-binding protein [Oceanobacillus sp. 1P07AA]|uniref:YlxQ family RNA-binding protein n=1 Tax=Oceanobacillus sp. 1P07AA TaxID=3132293 RepID=UPI0039A4D4FE
MNPSYLSILGLAVRARKCAFGEETILKEVRSNRAKLVLLASDIGPQTKKKITDKCKYYQIPFRFVDDRDTISHSIGKTHRVAVAILDAGFAKKLISLIGE